MLKNKDIWLSYLSLFTSFGTVICCALPVLLVTIGLGATFAGLLSVFPQIVWLSLHKNLVFIVSGFVIFISVGLSYLNRHKPCPIEPEKAKACMFYRKWSIKILIASALFWTVGAFFAFLAPLILV